MSHVLSWLNISAALVPCESTSVQRCVQVVPSILNFFVYDRWSFVIVVVAKFKTWLFLITRLLEIYFIIDLGLVECIVLS